MKNYDNRGWFIMTVGSLAAGEFDFVSEHNFCGVRKVAEVLNSLTFSGFARQSRKGWWTLEHPVLGLIQWKSGYDFRTCGEYLFLRVNGETVLRCWPSGDGRVTRAKWVSAPACTKEEADRHLRCRIERAEAFLGTLQTESSSESRRHYAEMQAMPDSALV